jgi:predicted nucleic acid-binding Zn ribbon protein
MEPAGRGLDKVIAQAMLRVPSEEVPLVAWPFVCGSVVAERTRAVSCKEGVLCVEVADAGWKRELQVLAPRYLSGINRYTRETVSRIEFVIAQPVSEPSSR